MRYHGEVWLPRRPLFPEALEPDVHSARWPYYTRNPESIRSLWQGAHASDAVHDRAGEIVNGIHPQDIIRTGDLPLAFMAHVLFYRDEAYTVLNWDDVPQKEGPLHGKTPNQMLAELGIGAGFFVTVDCEI